MEWSAAPSAPWSGRALAHLSGDKVAASAIAITCGTATATSIRRAANGIALPADIAVELDDPASTPRDTGFKGCKMSPAPYRQKSLNDAALNCVYWVVCWIERGPSQS